MDPYQLASSVASWSGSTYVLKRAFFNPSKHGKLGLLHVDQIRYSFKLIYSDKKERKIHET